MQYLVQGSQLPHTFCCGEMQMEWWGIEKRDAVLHTPLAPPPLNFNAFVYREKNSVLVFFQTKNNSVFISRPPCLYAIPQAP